MLNLLCMKVCKYENDAAQELAETPFIRRVAGLPRADQRGVLPPFKLRAGWCAAHYTQRRARASFSSVLVSRERTGTRGRRGGSWPRAGASATPPRAAGGAQRSAAAAGGPSTDGLRSPGREARSRRRAHERATTRRERGPRRSRAGPRLEARPPDRRVPCSVVYAAALCSSARRAAEAGERRAVRVRFLLEAFLSVGWNRSSRRRGRAGRGRAASGELRSSWRGRAARRPGRELV
jgi:hypothetical protein